MRKLLVVSVIALVLFLSVTPIMKVNAVADTVYSATFGGTSTERWVVTSGNIIESRGIGTYSANVIIEVYSNNTVYVVLDLTPYVYLEFLLDLRVMREYSSGMTFITASKTYNWGNYIDRYSVLIFIYPNGQLKMRLFETYVNLNTNPPTIYNYVNYVTATQIVA